MNRGLVLMLLLSASASAHAQGLMKSVGGGAGGGETPEAKAALPAFDDEKNYMFYVGADRQYSTLSVSDSNSFGGLNNTRYTSKFWDVRAGYRLFKAIGIEAHYGFPDQDANSPGRYKSRNYYGIFAVPTANVFDLFEIAFPLGYSNSGVTVNGTATDGTTPLLVQKHLNSVAYGANLEVPIRVFWRALPDFRITGGGMVYYQRSDAREYGYHFGLRYDFGFGTPAS
ncbi:MAG: hypothetical protein JOY51_06375 [Nevskia sp.]|nr:hypothetical protein [Nevskia sp.]